MRFEMFVSPVSIGVNGYKNTTHKRWWVPEHTATRNQRCPFNTGYLLTLTLAFHPNFSIKWGKNPPDVFFSCTILFLLTSSLRRPQSLNLIDVARSSHWGWFMMNDDHYEKSQLRFNDFIPYKVRNLRSAVVSISGRHHSIYQPARVRPFGATWCGSWSLNIWHVSGFWLTWHSFSTETG